MLFIDGAYGEGGGQVLRTALSLSVITGKPFKIFNLRANRPKPGLQPQHLACVKATAHLAEAEVKGDILGSQELTFIPKKLPERSCYRFNIGTAGSTLLLFQTVLYPLSLSKGGEVLIEGGTHVPFSPCYHYIKEVFLPTVKLLGLEGDLSLESYGFYPAGGGRIKAVVKPWERFSLPKLPESFIPGEISVYSIVSERLPFHIVERQLNGALTELEGFEKVSVYKERVKAKSDGTFVFLGATDQEKILHAGFTELGKKGYPAEEVGKKVGKEWKNFLSTKAQFEEHLADQVLIPLSLVFLKVQPSEFFEFSVAKITKHLLTQAWLIPKFFPELKIIVEGKEGEKGYVNLYLG
ncbi:RNA 3'-phosphate cyclase [Thermodesulfobacterium sp. TA1]|uniref:RNA 3'-terminal phosphate cyclase n=1 Tax=Thermodesulfobacterium sp. TA1 TaxID=2234087 RepID=UPI0012321D51|nr:RNA 3'-terminal phosphate cyclase [Thermodesulfobacterium sp. TA1]QER41693.1 RNA 3'-phosphate cyclase [Thermodesulfobacterium sp. TA1]